MSRPTFYEGDVVSVGYSHGVVITGRVIQLRRRSDGEPFLMVEITGHPKVEFIGRRFYPDAGWQLGAGPHEGTCERCRRAFRYDTGAVGHTCRRCWGEDATEAQAADPSRRASSWERTQRGRRELQRRLKDAS